MSPKLSPLFLLLAATLVAGQAIAQQPAPAEKTLAQKVLELAAPTKALRDRYILTAKIVEKPAQELLQTVPLFRGGGMQFNRQVPVEFAWQDASGNIQWIRQGAPVPQGLRQVTRERITLTPEQLVRGRKDKRFDLMTAVAANMARQQPQGRWIQEIAPEGHSDTDTGQLIAPNRDLPSLIIPTIECKFIWSDEPMGGNTPKFKCELTDKYGAKAQGGLAGSKIKVKYALNGHPESNRELGGEVLATRLLWAMGFGADKVYPVRIKCIDCPLPGNRPAVSFLQKPNAQAPRSTAAQPLFLEFAAIERKVDGEGELNLAGAEGWSWLELRNGNRTHLPLGTPARNEAEAEKDALRALIAFIQHSDNKPPQQRLYCEDLFDLPQAQGQCRQAFMLVQDVGATFGGGGNFTTSGAKMSLENWAKEPFWALSSGEFGLGKVINFNARFGFDELTKKVSFGPGTKYLANDGTLRARNKIACETNLTRSQTAIDGEGTQNAALHAILTPITRKLNTPNTDQVRFFIQEPGRAYLARRLMALTDTQILAMIYASRAYLYPVGPTGVVTTLGDLRGQVRWAEVNKWLAAFREKIAQVAGVQCASQAEILAIR
jgi:hypothetical protein